MNYRTCSLRFDIKEKSLSKLSLRFASIPFFTVPHFSISIGAFAVSERVFTTEACDAPGGVYTQGPELQLDVSALQRPVLLLEVSTPQELELHLNVSAQQRLVLLLKVSTPQGLELYLNVSAQQKLVLLVKVSTPGAELHLNVSALHYRHVPTYCPKCSLRFENNLLNVGHVRFAS